MYKIKNIYLSVYRLTIMAGPHRYIMYFAVVISFMNALTDGLLTFGLIGLATDEKFFLNKDLDIKRVSCTF